MKLSVIVPVYNVEKYLHRCVQSIIAQGVADYELILVDDGSTDRSAVLCDELLLQHADIIKVIHQPNGGLSTARNKGIEAARGDYITFVDSDDELCLDTLEDNMQYLLAHPEVDMLEYPVEVHAESEKAYHLTFPDETQTEDIFADWIRREGHMHCYAWNKIYSAHLWRHIRFPQGEYYEDTAVMPRIVSQCRQIHYSSRGCYRYIMHSGTITTSYKYDKQRQLYINSHRLYSEIKSNPTLRVEALRMWIYCLNLLVDMGRCHDVDRADHAHIIALAAAERPTYKALIEAASCITTRIKLLALPLLGLDIYCRTYAALTKTLKA